MGQFYSTSIRDKIHNHRGKQSKYQSSVYIFSHLFKDYTKMLSVCCCCVPLRTGSIILAVLGILQGLGSFGQGNWPYIISEIIALAYGGCLLFGAIKYHEKAVLVALIIQGVMLAISALFCIIILAS